jgi:hypothetical protein
VTLKHVSRKKIPFPQSKVGLAILALWYLGKKLTTTEVISKIENKISSLEFKKFISSREYMPAWMSKVVLEYKNKKETENAGIIFSSTAKRTSSKNSNYSPD